MTRSVTGKDIAGRDRRGYHTGAMERRGGENTPHYTPLSQGFEEHERPDGAPLMEQIPSHSRMRSLRSKQRQIYWRIFKRWLLRLLFKRFGFNRTTAFVAEEYGRAWSKPPSYLDGEAGGRPIFRELNGNLVQWKEIDIVKFRVLRFSRIITDLRLTDDITSVLELGSGNGINILALAVLHPEIKVWRGIDLTPQGIRAATWLLTHPPLAYLKFVTGLDEKVIGERLSNRDIQFQLGNMLTLPHADGSYDLAFTSQSIEQLPRDYLRAFREIRRVTKKYAIFLEEFREVQNVFNRMHLKNVDYFCASFQELSDAGFRILKFEPYPLSSLYLRLGLAVCSAADPSRPPAESS